MARPSSLGPASTALAIAGCAAIAFVACSGDSGSRTAESSVSPIARSECGPTVLKPNGDEWQCTFADEFDGAALDRTKWAPQLTANSGFRNGPECYRDDPANISVSDGTLKLTARQESAPFFCASPFLGFVTQWTGAMVSTFQRFSQTYGRFEIRAKFPGATTAGLQSALWLSPQTLHYGPWPLSGEIDIAELYSNQPDRVTPYVHYVSALPDANATGNCVVSNPGDFHTYVAEWTPSTITIEYDGAVCIVDDWHPLIPPDKPAPFDQPFFVALTQALGQGTNTFDPLTTPLPATMEIDWVHVWK